MIKFIELLQSFGDQLLEYMVFPLLIWTAIAIPMTLCLKKWDSFAPVYQYHSRTTLLLALPLGIAGACFSNFLGSMGESSGSAALFVIQNPVSISVSGAGVSTVSATDPMLWMGILGILLAAGTVFLLIKIISNFIELRMLETGLQFKPLSQYSELVSNLPEISPRAGKTLVAYSTQASIPFTYKWRKTKIVIPADLKNDGDALSMAVQHELMHIKHHDFVLNGLLLFIKALFWFHPLVHHLYNSGREYREITCDGQVLANNHFSKKRYARLLVDLAQKEHHSNLAMSMAVNPSSLKKRIQIMSSQTNLTSKYRSSFLVSLASLTLIVLAISCTDMEENGITNTEFQEAQKQLSTQQQNAPLYIINGEVMGENENVLRIKPKYIKSMNVLKGQEATDNYGPKGKNGVIEIQFIEGIDRETVFADLKETEDFESDTPQNEEHYVAVEKMPELIGGLASLQQKIKYPEEARKAGIEGKVIVRFIVNKEGEIENPEILRGIGGGCDEESIRVVKEANFKPGTRHGEPVRVQYSLPISYKLSAKSEG